MDFGDAAGGMLTVRGGDGSDVFSAGRRGLAFNGDVDPEVTGFPRDPENPSGLSFFGGEGDDRLSARGGSGTGGPAAWAWPHFSGSFGDDSLLSGPGRSTLSGDGDDVEYGGDGDDVLYEGPRPTEPTSCTVTSRSPCGAATTASTTPTGPSRCR